VDGLVGGVDDRALFPTDGSEASDVATDHALAIADRFGIPLHALFVVDTSSIQTTDAYATSNFEATLEAIEAEGRQRIEAVEDRATEAGVEVSSDVVEGRPATDIVETTADGDVVVMGIHGRTGLDRYLIGSTTEKVVRTADVPVVTVPVPDDVDSDE
jgi:nucleotide-binding universal stress UspA family protein